MLPCLGSLLPLPTGTGHDKAFIARRHSDRQFIVLAGAAHAIALGFTRSHLWHVVRAFLTLPKAEA